jgi:hypothetical protein
MLESRIKKRQKTKSAGENKPAPPVHPSGQTKNYLK